MSSQWSTKSRFNAKNICIGIVVAAILAISLYFIVKHLKKEKTSERYQTKPNQCGSCIDEIQKWYDNLINIPLKNKLITENDVKQAWPQVELLLTWLVGPCIHGFWKPETVAIINKVTKLSDLPEFTSSIVGWWSRYLGNLKYDEKQILQVRDYFNNLWNNCSQ